MTKQSVYDDSSIKVLSPLDAIRKRPGMYIGDSDIVSATLAREAIENGNDELGAGFGTTLTIRFSEDNRRIYVEDDGRGIPIGENTESGMSNLKAIFTIPHSGGKFEEDSYNGVSGGLHGIGITAANCFSKELDVWTFREGLVRHLHTEHSVPSYWDDSQQCWIEDKDYDPQPYPVSEHDFHKEHGTIITFTIDHEITSLEGYGKYFLVDMILERVRELSFLTPGATYNFSYESKGEVIEEKIYSDSPLDYFMENVFTYGKNEEVYTQNPIYIDKTFDDDTSVQAIVGFTSGNDRNFLAFTNTMRNRDGGTHVVGMQEGLFSALYEYGLTDENGEAFEFEQKDLCLGLYATLSIKIKDAKYSSQTKDKLSTRSAKAFVSTTIYEEMRVWISENIAVAKNLAEAASIRYSNRKNSQRSITLKKTVELNSAKDGSRVHIVSKNYVECRSNKAAECELFIVEGDSASGLLKKVRNKETQALFQLKGKIPNAARKSEAVILNNDELGELGKVTGAGILDICDPAKSRFHKYILAVDADADGSHIRSLLLAYFNIYARPLIEAGYIYAVDVPLYGATNHRKYKGYTAFGNSYKELVAEIEELPNTSSLDDLSETELMERLKGWSITRYKGLGEMSKEQTFDTLANPESRKLRKILAEDVFEDETSCYNHMGDDTYYRKEALGGIPRLTDFDIAAFNDPQEDLEESNEIPQAAEAETSLEG